MAQGSPGARLDVTSDLPALEATAAPTGERLISCCCSGLWLGRTGLAWGTHTGPPSSFSLTVLCTGLNHVPHKIHVPPGAQNVTFSGNRILAEVTKTRSNCSRGRPSTQGCPYEPRQPRVAHSHPKLGNSFQKEPTLPTP